MLYNMKLLWQLRYLKVPCYLTHFFYCVLFCFQGSLHISALLRESPVHQLALRIEPRGTLYLKLRHTPPHIAFRRSGGSGLPSHTMFGADLDAVVARESGMAAVTGAGGAPSASVPVLVRRCVEEVERRGLDIIGLYRLCGSATKKRILREAFERNPRTVDLSPDNVPDINVITGKEHMFINFLSKC
jgi:hypothetical protein